MSSHYCEKEPLGAQAQQNKEPGFEYRFAEEIKKAGDPKSTSYKSGKVYITTMPVISINPP